MKIGYVAINSRIHIEQTEDIAFANRNIQINEDSGIIACPGHSGFHKKESHCEGSCSDCQSTDSRHFIYKKGWKS